MEREMVLFNRTSRVWAILCTLILCSGCGINVVNFLADKEASAEIKKEQARVHLDNGEYEDAEKILEPMTTTKEDSNEIRLMLAAAKLGAAEVGVWDIFSKILKSSTGENSEGASGLFTSALESVLGTGDAQEAKINALLEVILLLQNAPDQTETTALNTACILGGLVAIPVGSNLTNSMSGIVSALQSISTDITNEQCDTTPLDTSMTSIDRAVTIFNTLRSLITQCPFFANSSEINAVDTLLDTLVASADKGCSTPTCNIPGIGSCDSLFPGCIRSVLSSSTTAVAAGDGVVGRCEIFMHCLNPLDCFQF